MPWFRRLDRNSITKESFQPNSVSVQLDKMRTNNPSVPMISAHSMRPPAQRRPCTLGSTATRTNHVVPAKVLALASDLIAPTNKAYTLVDEEYADEALLEILPVVHAANDAEDGDFNRTYDVKRKEKVERARKPLKDFQGLVKFAHGQAALADKRLRVAQAQVSLAQDQVAWAEEQLASALNA